MNQKNFTILVLLLVVLGAAFYATRDGGVTEAHDSSQFLLGDVKIADVARIQVQQADNNIELEYSDGKWGVPSRGGYSANFGKVKSLMLKLLELSVSQEITSNEDNFDSLGVSDASVSKGRGNVTLFSGDGKEVASLYLGENRKKEGNAPSMSIPTGQYIRRKNQNRVYLIRTPITVVATHSYWLDTSLANVLQSNIQDVSQFALSGDGKESLEFLLKRSSEEGNLDFSGELKDGEIINDVEISQIRSGLENLTFEDVFKVDDEAVGGLSYQYKVVYRLKNALRYIVFFAEKGEKQFIRVEVDFDEAYAEAKKLEHAKAEDASTEKEEDGEKEDEASESEKPKLELASKEEAKQLQEKFKPWVFQLKKFLGQKFQVTKDKLIAEERSEEESEKEGE